jgi:hypothetical protein
MQIQPFSCFELASCGRRCFLFLLGACLICAVSGYTVIRRFFAVGMSGVVRGIGTFAILGFFALAGCHTTPTAAPVVGRQPQKPLFVRILVSDKCTVYVQYQDAKLRAATSVAELKDARPIHSQSLPEGGDFGTRDFMLPIPPDRLPANDCDIQASLDLSHGHIVTSFGTSDYLLIRGHITINRVDAEKTPWQWVISVNAQASEDPDLCDTIVLPAPNHLRLAVVPKASDGKLAVGVHVQSGDEIFSIRKANSPAPARMVITDSAGAVVASKDGNQDDFGFS